MDNSGYSSDYLHSTSYFVKKKAEGRDLTIPLQFGSWSIDEIEKILTDIHKKYDLKGCELDYVDRGRITTCKGYDDHKACGELVELYGSIVFKRV